MAQKHLFEDFKKNKFLEGLPSFKEKRTQAITTITLTLVASSIFGFFAINPTVSTIVQLQKQLEDSRFVDQKLGEKIKNLGILQQHYTSLSSDLPFIFGALPESHQAPILVGQMQSLTSSHNLKIKRLQTFQVEITPLKNVRISGQTPTSTKRNDYASYSFSLEAEGTFENIMAFISSVTQAERIVTIDLLSLDKGSKKGEILLSIRGKAYFKY